MNDYENRTVCPHGYSLIELLTSIAIIAVLATLSFSGWGFLQQKSLRAQAKEILYQISLDQQQYRSKNTQFNNTYTLATDQQKSFDFLINTATEAEFSATLRLKANLVKIDSNCTTYALSIISGKVVIKSSPSEVCL